jgi:hypothetical protein
MEVKCIKDIIGIDGHLHDSELGGEDSRFDAESKIFHLKSYSKEFGKEYYLEFRNVEKYDPLNLDKIRKGKATGGVFNMFKIRSKGRKLIILSQDLRIILRLSKISGKFEIANSTGNNK